MLNKKLNRILFVDDTSAIHEDFRSALHVEQCNAELVNARSKLFGENTIENNIKEEIPSYVIDSAYQGEEALFFVKNAISDGYPYSLAFIDIRMPPGWDGIETIQALWKVDPHLEIVICSAYSDYSWEEIYRQLKGSDNVLILKKPFDMIEVRQMASTLTKKWQLKKQVQQQLENLNLMKAHLENSLSLLQTTLESTQEGIVVLNHEGKVIIYNKIFQKMWGIPDQIIENEKNTMILTMSSQVENAAFFIDAMSNKKNFEQIEGNKKWKLKSGKILELYICPQQLNNETIGNVCSFRDVTRLEELNEELLKQATHDSLTGLPNRILLDDRINQSIIQAKRFNFLVGILMIDLDNFKTINDSLGHHAGDKLLQAMAQKASSCIREMDTLTRLGGDEFVMVLSAQSGEENITNYAKKILEAISTSYQIDNHELNITASMGISVYPKDGEDSETLIKNADSALYFAKSQGRSNFQYYSAAFNELVLEKLELSNELRAAIKKGQFTIFYQPLIEVGTNQVIGVEALLRWNHPTLGKILPSVFIPLAEEIGLIQSIGEWVLKKACLQIKSWEQLGYNNLKIAVNVSSKQFQQRNFVETVKNIVEEVQIDPKKVELELTETIILNDFTECIQKMEELKKIGIALSIDDFGTGYSSLSYLKYFNFDKIKIDKSFIHGIGENSNDNTIINAIIAIAKQLDITVLAEGVENEKQVQFMNHHSGSQIQGYYYSHPLDEKTCINFIEKNYKINQENFIKEKSDI